MLLDTKAAEIGPDLDAAVGRVLVAPCEIVEEITGFPFHRGVLAIARRRPPADAADLAARASTVVVAEGVNDHENIGSLFRNAAAFGAGAVLLDPSCCDPLYRRSVRVSMGHVLAVPFATLQPWPGSLGELGRAGFTVVALTPSGDTPLELAADRYARKAEKIAVVVGSEDRGLSAGALELADVLVRIPMAEGVDSLNVATAAAIALSRLRPACGTHLR